MKKKSSIPHATKKKLSKWVKIPLGILTAILVILLAYVIYLYAAYHRIPDNQELAVEAPTEQAHTASLTTGQTYHGSRLPDHVLSIVEDGGLRNHLKRILGK